MKDPPLSLTPGQGLKIDDIKEALYESESETKNPMIADKKEPPKIPIFDRLI